MLLRSFESTILDDVDGGDGSSDSERRFSCSCFESVFDDRSADFNGMFSIEASREEIQDTDFESKQRAVPCTGERSSLLLMDMALAARAVP